MSCNQASTTLMLLWLWAPALDWWRMASTLAAGGATTVTAVAPITNADPLAQARLTGWASRTNNAMLTAVGIGGHQLTTLAFNAGVATLQQMMTGTNERTLSFERARANRSFTDKHGASMAQRLYHLTGAADDDHLPEIH